MGSNSLSRWRCSGAIQRISRCNTYSRLQHPHLKLSPVGARIAASNADDKPTAKKPETEKAETTKSQHTTSMFTFGKGRSRHDRDHRSSSTAVGARVDTSIARDFPRVPATPLLKPRGAPDHRVAWVSVQSAPPLTFPLATRVHERCRYPGTVGRPGPAACSARAPPSGRSPPSSPHARPPRALATVAAH